MKSAFINALAALAVTAACLCGCAHDVAPPPAGWLPTVYYLYPGEPAPVEGPQFTESDYERMQAQRDALKKHIADLVAGVAHE